MDISNRDSYSPYSEWAGRPGVECLGRPSDPLSNLFFRNQGASSPGVKQAGRETEHYTPSSAEVKDQWNSTSATHICLQGMDTGSAFLFLNWLYIFSHTEGRRLAEGVRE